MPTYPISITTRSGKGSPLNAAEFDANLTNLRDATTDLNTRITGVTSGTTLAGNSDKVDGFHASQTPGASKVVVADTGGTVNAWVAAGTAASAGKLQLATPAESVTGTNTAKAVTPATARQAVLYLMRDSLGKFPGITPPSLNLFCGDATSDAAPVGTFTRSTTGTRLGQAGLIETVAAGSIRREWGTAGARKGWLVEASATNLLTYSEQFATTAWSKTGLTVTGDMTAAPDGNLTADKIIEDTSTFHRIQGQASTILDTYHSLSIFIKGAGRTNLGLYLFNGADTSSFIRASYDLTTKSTTKASYGNGLATNAQIIDMEDGWYYLTLSGIIDSTTQSGTVLAQIRITDSSGNESYTGDGSSGLYAWGIQLETGPYPTSYIPTTSAAVARSADVWTIPLATSWFNTATGTIFVAGRTANGVPTTETAQYLLIYVNDLRTDFIYVSRNRYNEITCFVGSGGVTIAYLNLGAVANATTFRVAFSWSSSRFSASLNGGACVTATATALPSGLTTCRIGSDAVGGHQWDGHILHSAYFPCVLSDAQLQAITL